MQLTATARPLERFRRDTVREWTATAVAGQWLCPPSAGTEVCGWATGVTYNVYASHMCARCRTENLLRWKVQISHLHVCDWTLVVRTYRGACESSLSSGHILVFIMEAPCVLCEVRIESLCECRIPSLHRWLVALLLGFPFQPPSPVLRATLAHSRALFLLPRPPSFLGAVPLISFNQFLRRSDQEPHEGLDTTAVTRNMILTLTSLQYCFFWGRLFIELLA